MSVPEGVTVREEWAVKAGDGEIYRVLDDSREIAEREAQLLREGVDNEPEPDARAARRFVMASPDGMVSTGWRWTW